MVNGEWLIVFPDRVPFARYGLRGNGLLWRLGGSWLLVVCYLSVPEGVLLDWASLVHSK